MGSKSRPRHFTHSKAKKKTNRKSKGHSHKPSLKRSRKIPASISSTLASIYLRLDAVHSHVVTAVDALKFTNADNDDDIAVTLRCALNKLFDEMERIDTLAKEVA